MADRPILFSGAMIRALLAGTKSQTRRILKPQPERPAMYAGTWLDEAVEQFRGGMDGEMPITPYAIGDQLWCRETWIAISDENEISHIKYRATCPEGICGRWRPSIHMPRWASRLTLVVTDVRVQRLLNISEEDAQAEGFTDGPIGEPMLETPIGDGWTVSSPGGWASAAGHFQAMWSKLHPDWDGFSSPWVAAITFDVHRCNIDAMPEAPTRRAEPDGGAV